MKKKNLKKLQNTGGSILTKNNSNISKVHLFCKLSTNNLKGVQIQYLLLNNN